MRSNGMPSGRRGRVLAALAWRLQRRSDAADAAMREANGLWAAGRRVTRRDRRRLRRKARREQRG